MAVTISVELQFRLSPNADAEATFESLVEKLNAFESSVIVDLDGGVDIENKVIHLNAEAAGDDFAKAEQDARSIITELMRSALNGEEDFQLVSVIAEAGQEKLIGSL